MLEQSDRDSLARTSKPKPRDTIATDEQLKKMFRDSEKRDRERQKSNDEQGRRLNEQLRNRPTLPPLTQEDKPPKSSREFFDDMWPDNINGVVKNLAGHFPTGDDYVPDNLTGLLNKIMPGHKYGPNWSPDAPWNTKGPGPWQEDQASQVRSANDPQPTPESPDAWVLNNLTNAPIGDATHTVPQMVQRPGPWAKKGQKDQSGASTYASSSQNPFDFLLNRIFGPH